MILAGEARRWFPSATYATVPCAIGRHHALALHEAGSPEPARPRLLDRVREAIRARHCSRGTEKAYVHWNKRYIFFQGKRHPAEMGAVEVSRFLTFLAVDEKVAASTQNRALAALLFLYRRVLDIELPWLDDVVRAKWPKRRQSSTRPLILLSRTTPPFNVVQETSRWAAGGRVTHP
jgi:hypothetical protein